ncbi:hypothetical protein [Aeromicrobium sp. Leaf350]|uniref:hypothetical protein n=1 Tax=Aeromicrobium sp. Leaf350 TaxID=2876565 RepID=UPI001E591928|nr:hypothetical protein [Aeromicrobium sp. Leaf350]
MQEYLSAGPPLVLTLSVVLAAVAVSAVLVHVVRQDRRTEKWERDVIERALEPDDETKDDEETP